MSAGYARWLRPWARPSAGVACALGIVACATGDTPQSFVFPLDSGPSDAATESVPSSASEAGQDATPEASVSDVSAEPSNPASCDESSPADSAKYAQEYQEAVAKGTNVSCANGCAQTECCYEFTACLPR
jgi:hypothetical protein